jgi:hypothetical protein
MRSLSRPTIDVSTSVLYSNVGMSLPPFETIRRRDYRGVTVGCRGERGGRWHPVSTAALAESSGIEGESEIDALIRLEVACTLALRALPHLPNETEQALASLWKHFAT